MADSIHVVCPNCNQTNRLPSDRVAGQGKCGRCQSTLIDTTPFALTLANFQKHISQNDLPVVVDFWAHWCGPCKMMSPVFEQAAQEMLGQVRFAKVDTEQEQALSGQVGIRSIPTLALYRQGLEIARIAGAMDLQNLKAWINQNISQ